MEDIILFGTGGHAHSVVDSIEEAGEYNIIGFLDTEEMQGKHFRDYQVLDTDDAGYIIPNIIDRTAVISPNAMLEDGIFVGKRAVINAGVSMGEMCIVNTGAVVEHDCVVGSFSHIAVGSVLCGGVSVGTQTLIGANATVIQNIEIGNNVIVGAGAVICKNVQDNIIRYGMIEKLKI